jgi:hypothetical protein
MTMKTWEIGDKVGRFTIDEFAGTKIKTGEPSWWCRTETGDPVIKTDRALRAELRRADITPQMIQNMSAKAYNELREEIGEDGIDEILGALKPKNEAPPSEQQVKIAQTWWEAHPQIPQTRANVQLFDKYLREMANPTFASADFNKAFTDLFFELELNPKAAGIDGFGEGIRGETAIRKLTATQIEKLQRAYPTKPKTQDLTPDQALRAVVDPMTADQFGKWTKQVDAEKGIQQPVPPLLAHAREQTWSSFFQLNPSVIRTSELQDKLLKFLKEKELSFAVQHLGLALTSLIEQGDESVVRQGSGVHSYGGTKMEIYEPRPKSPALVDNAPIAVTAAEINAMDSKTYGEKILNPEFRKAVDALTQSVGSR